MYVPASFAEIDPTKMADLIATHSFGMLISYADSKPFVSHLPLMFDPVRGTKGILTGHMARPNPQWQQADGQQVMAVFMGPHAYISPTWYGEKNVVPTWNYTAVHVHGTFRAIHDVAATMKILEETVKVYEKGMPSPWQFDPVDDFQQKLSRGVVAFEIEVSEMVGKWKLNQNHPVQRREGAIRGLKETGDPDALAIAALMEETLRPQNG